VSEPMELGKTDLRRAANRSAAGLVVAACLLACFVVPAAASASVYPSPPSGLRVTAVSATSLTVTTNKSANATSYRLYVSTVHADLFYVNLVAGKKTAALRSAWAWRPSVSITGLHYTTAPYYYRVEAVNGSKHSFSAGIPMVGLRPSTPTKVAVTSTAKGTYLTWSSGAANGFTVAQGTDAAITRGRLDYTIHGIGHQFTPPRLTKGVRYYFRVRAMNTHTPSGYAAAVRGTARSNQQSVKVMTYNILQADSDGTRAQGGIISPWAQRRIPAATLIKHAAPDVVAIEEGWPWVAQVGGPRQVDSLVTTLQQIGATYNLAVTEIPPSQPGHHRYGNYILYKPSVYRAVGAGGILRIGTPTAAWQELQDIATGAKFLFVATHLTEGASYDTRREQESQSMLAQAGAKAKSLNVPVIYAGDFNSRPGMPLDGPGVAMRAANVIDARTVAQSRTNEKYDSLNNYMRVAQAYGLDIDYLFAPAGVSVTSWGVLLNLVHGSFVGVIPSDHNPVWAQVSYPY